MNYEIIGDTFQMVKIEICSEESVYCEAGSMIFMDDNIKLMTTVYGGIIRGIKRAFIKESFFMNEFKVNNGCGTVTIGSNSIGKIIPITLGRPHILQKRAFLCAEGSVRLDIAFTKKLGAGLFGKEGFVFQHLSGRGVAFAKVSGDYVCICLEKGEKIFVDTGMIAAFEDTVSYDVELIRHPKTILFGKEGLFLSTLTGPGNVYLNSMDPVKLYKKNFANLNIV